MRGEVLLAALRRSQLRLALAITSAFLTTLGALLLLYWGSDWFRSAHVATIPVIWLALGVGVFPFIVVLGWLHIRMAEWYEQQFIDLIEDV